MSKIVVGLCRRDSRGGLILEAGSNTVVRLRQEYEQVIEPGVVVFDEGDPGDQLYVIQSGEVELSREEAGGQRVVQLAH